MNAKLGLLASLALLWSASGCRPPGGQASGTATGEVARDIVGVDLDGVAFQLSDYAGKVVILDFWGDW